MPDVRGSNQAIDLWAKMRGLYPGKVRPDGGSKPQQVQIAVAMLPQEEPRKPEAQVYTLPMPKERLGDGSDE